MLVYRSGPYGTTSHAICIQNAGLVRVLQSLEITKGLGADPGVFFEKAFRDV